MSAPYQPRFVAYARAQGRTAEEQAALDAQRPTGRMMPFIVWIGRQWAEWDRVSGHRVGDPHSPQDHLAFDAWLLERFQPAQEAA